MTQASAQGEVLLWIVDEYAAVDFDLTQIDAEFEAELEARSSATLGAYFDIEDWLSENCFP